MNLEALILPSGISCQPKTNTITTITRVNSIPIEIGNSPLKCFYMYQNMPIASPIAYKLMADRCQNHNFKS